jgi:hypothetical protein
MSPNKIIRSAAEDGVRISLSATGSVKAVGSQEWLDAWLPILRDNKDALLEELHRQRRCEKVLSMLGNRRYAVFVEDEKSDPVIVACAIAGLATFELAIPAHCFNGAVLLELIEKHAIETSESSGNTHTSPTANKRSQSPRRAA